MLRGEYMEGYDFLLSANSLLVLFVFLVKEVDGYGLPECSWISHISSVFYRTDVYVQAFYCYLFVIIFDGISTSFSTVITILSAP